MGPNTYQVIDGSGEEPTCEVEMALVDDRLKVVGTCANEAGPSNLLREFWFDAPNRLQMKYGDGSGGTLVFYRCSEAELDAADAALAEAQRPQIFIPTTSWAYSYPSQAAAERAALNGCSGSCRIAISVRDACAAIAVGKYGGWGTAWNSNRGRAQRGSIRSCNKVDNGCQVASWIRPYGGSAP